jgi:hypothetical protein
MRLTSAGAFLFGTTTPSLASGTAAWFNIVGSSTYATSSIFRVASGTGLTLFNINAAGNITMGTTTQSGFMNLQSFATTSPIFTLASSTGANVLRIGADGTMSVGGLATSTARLSISNSTTTVQNAMMNTVLHVIGDTSTTTGARILVDSFNLNGAQFTGRSARGNGSAPTQTQADDGLVAFGGVGYAQTTYATTSRGSFNVKAANTWTDASMGTYLTFETTQSGTNNAVERMRINNDGSLSIGTTTVAGGFNYQAVATTSNIFRIASSTGANVFSLGAAGNMMVGTSTANGAFNLQAMSTSSPIFSLASSTGASVFRIGANGTVAMGTTTTQAENVLTLGPSANNGTIEGGQLMLLPGTIRSTSWGIDNYEGSFRILTGDGQGNTTGSALSIASTTKYLGVNETNAIRQFQVTSNDATLAGAYIVNTNTGVNANALSLGLGNTGTLGATNLFISLRKSATAGAVGTEIGSVSGNGAGGVAFNTTSDERLKTDTGLNAKGLDALMGLKVYNFNWKESGVNNDGFFAQQLYTIFPQAVATGTDEVDENGNLVNPWKVDYGALTPMLAKAIQDLNNKVFGSAQTQAISIEEITASSTISVDDKLKALGINAKNVNDMLEQLASTTATRTAQTVETTHVTSATTSEICSLGTIAGSEKTYGSIYTSVTPIVPTIEIEGNNAPTQAQCVITTYSTTTTQTTELTFVGKVLEVVKTWLADASNGITKIFVGEVETKNLCVADDNGNKTCLTESQLKSLLDDVKTLKDSAANAQSGNGGGSSGSGSESGSGSGSGSEGGETPEGGDTGSGSESGTGGEEGGTGDQPSGGGETTGGEPGAGEGGQE